MTEPHAVVALEQAALTAWCRGDPSPFLALSAEDVTYFDPYQPRRLDGLAALSALYESLRGQIRADHHEMIDPAVTELGGGVVLTFRFDSWNDDRAKALRWNCTEVYRRDAGAWRIVQTHWSYTAAA